MRKLKNTNFTNKDLVVHLTYTEKELGKSEEEARKDVEDFIGRLNHYRQKNNLTPLRIGGIKA